MELARLIEHLSDPRAYPDPTTKVDVHQTHISVVFVTDTFAYKIKKPIALDFLDYSTLEKRRHWCEEEVRLNRRLAPRIYLGVVPIAKEEPRVSVEGNGAVVEWAVKMQSLPAKSSLTHTVTCDGLSHEAIQALASRIAEFHRHAERGSLIARFARFDVVARNARDNFDQSHSHIGTTMSPPVFERVRSLTEEALGRYRALIEDRADRGMACDGHGDIRMDHVYLFPDKHPPDDMAIVDCIEFNIRFRAADPIADMAFLVMDLIRHGRRDLAHSFRNAYLAYAGDGQGEALMPLYVSYRAVVRAKVNGIKAGSPEVSASERDRARHDARAQWLVALGALEGCPKRPCLVLMGGLPGTGKSTLSQSLASQAGFEVVRTDQIRKDLAHAAGVAGRNSGDGYATGIYTSEWNERTYQECIDRVETALFEGKRVIVDASFREEWQRLRFLDLAAKWSVPGTLLVCQADAGLVKARLDARRDDVSDADWAVYLQAASRWEPLGPRTRECFHMIDSSRTDLAPVIQALDVLRTYQLWD